MNSKLMKIQAVVETAIYVDDWWRSRAAVMSLTRSAPMPSRRMAIFSKWRMLVIPALIAS